MFYRGWGGPVIFSPGEQTRPLGVWIGYSPSAPSVCPAPQSALRFGNSRLKIRFRKFSKISRFFAFFAIDFSLQQRVAPPRKHPNTTQPGPRFVHVLQQVPAPQSALRNSRFKILFRQISKNRRFFVIFATEISLQQRVAPP